MGPSVSPGDSPTAREIEKRLRRDFEPSDLAIRDDSAKHAGHAGATSGGGHYKVRIVSGRFEGLPLLERHRAVHESLAGMIGGEIHALGLETLTPREWQERDPSA